MVNRQPSPLSITLSRAKTGYVGIYPSAVPTEIREKISIPENEGVLIRQVLPGGPADKSGLKQEDILLQIDGMAVTPRSLGTVLQRIGAGETVTCLVLRKKERIKIQLTLGERPSR